MRRNIEIFSCDKYRHQPTILTRQQAVLNRRTTKYQKFVPKSFSVSATKKQQREFGEKTNLFNIKDSLLNSRKSMVSELFTKPKIQFKREEKTKAQQPKFQKKLSLKQNPPNDQMLQLTKSMLGKHLSFNQKSVENDESFLDVIRDKNNIGDSLVYSTHSKAFSLHENKMQLSQIASDLKKISIELRKKLLQSQLDLDQWSLSFSEGKNILDHQDVSRAQKILQNINIYLNDVITKTTDIMEMSHYLESQCFDKKNFTNKNQTIIQTSQGINLRVRQSEKQPQLLTLRNIKSVSQQLPSSYIQEKQKMSQVDRLQLSADIESLCQPTIILQQQDFKDEKMLENKNKKKSDTHQERRKSQKNQKKSQPFQSQSTYSINIQNSDQSLKKCSRYLKKKGSLDQRMKDFDQVMEKIKGVINISQKKENNIKFYSGKY